MASTQLFLLLICTLTGICCGQKNTCATDQETMMSQIVTCIIKDHPEYFLTILTKMGNPQSMESADFLCSNPDLTSAMVDCFMKYLENCMAPGIASQAARVMPTKETILRGVNFLCKHRDGFYLFSRLLSLKNLFICSSSSRLNKLDRALMMWKIILTSCSGARNDLTDPCLNAQYLNIMRCFSTKIQAFFSTTNTKSPQDALCSALRIEEKCLADNLQGCPASASSSLMSGLLALFPAEDCHIQVQVPNAGNNVLTFQSDYQK